MRKAKAMYSELAIAKETALSPIFGRLEGRGARKLYIEQKGQSTSGGSCWYSGAVGRVTGSRASYVIG